MKWNANFLPFLLARLLACLGTKQRSLQEKKHNYNIRNRSARGTSVEKERRATTKTWLDSTQFGSVRIGSFSHPSWCFVIKHKCTKPRAESRVKLTQLLKCQSFIFLRAAALPCLAYRFIHNLSARLGRLVEWMVQVYASTRIVYDKCAADSCNWTNRIVHLQSSLTHSPYSLTQTCELIWHTITFFVTFM